MSGCGLHLQFWEQLAILKIIALSISLQIFFVFLFDDAKRFKSFVSFRWQWEPSGLERKAVGVFFNHVVIDVSPPIQ